MSWLLSFKPRDVSPVKDALIQRRLMFVTAEQMGAYACGLPLSPEASPWAGNVTAAQRNDLRNKGNACLKRLVERGTLNRNHIPLPHRVSSPANHISQWSKAEFREIYDHEMVATVHRACMEAMDGEINTPVMGLGP